MSNQADARRRAESQLADAKRSGANQRDIAKLEAAVNAAKAEEDRAKRSSGGAASRAMGW